MLKMKSINLNKFRKLFLLKKINFASDLNIKHFSTSNSTLVYPKEKMKMKIVSESSDWSEKENFDSEWDETQHKSHKRNQKEEIKDEERENIVTSYSIDPSEFSLNTILEEDELINDIIYKQSTTSPERNFKSKIFILKITIRFIK